MSFFLHKNKEMLAEYGTMQGTWSSVFCKELIVYLPSTCAENIVLHKYTKKNGRCMFRAISKIFGKSVLIRN